MTDLALPQFNMSPPLSMIEEMCKRRARVLELYNRILESQRKIDHAGNFPVVLERGYGYGASIDRSMERLTKDVDARLWIDAINQCQFGVLMNQDDLDALLHDIKDNPMPFTRETAISTLLARFERASQTFIEGLVSLFKALDRSYKSNQGWCVKKRVIVGEHKLGRLNDLQRILMLLNGEKPQAMEYDELLAEQVKRQARNGIYEGETSLLRWRHYGNGNTHVWVTRWDLLDHANLLIAEHYGQAIGER